MPPLQQLAWCVVWVIIPDLPPLIYTHCILLTSMMPSTKQALLRYLVEVKREGGREERNFNLVEAFLFRNPLLALLLHELKSLEENLKPTILNALALTVHTATHTAGRLWCPGARCYATRLCWVPWPELHVPVQGSWHRSDHLCWDGYHSTVHWSQPTVCGLQTHGLRVGLA